MGVGMSGWLGVFDVIEFIFIFFWLFECVVFLIVGGEWVIW